MITVAKPMLDDFLTLSQALLGVPVLDQNLGCLYLDRLNSTPFSPHLREIFDRMRTFKPDSPFADQVKAQIVASDALRPTVTQIVLLWYTSAMQDNTTLPANFRYGSQEEYFSGLAWQVIAAHVPGLSGGYFGHWRYRPENEPKAAKQ
jgi:hypothetical protein